jgi:hypothetical protein
MTDTTDDLSRLDDAIGRISREVLASMIRVICQTNPSAREFVKGQLFVNEDEVPQPGAHLSPSEASEVSDDGDDSNDREIASPPLKSTEPKRLRPRYAVCMNCNKEFDVSENTRKSCSYHPGMYSVATYPNPISGSVHLNIVVKMTSRIP